jgi:phospholipase A1
MNYKYKLSTIFLLSMHLSWAFPGTLLEREVLAQNEAASYPNLINLYKPSYVLPFYLTEDPYHSIYVNETPNNQLVKEEELKAYFSFVVPLIRHVYKDKPLSLNIAYSQLMYWQVYAKSQYFRETNYEPELFVENHFSPYMAAQIGLNHQSNGRGGYLERSWNRAYLQLKFTGTHWLMQLRGWSLVGENHSSNIHNPDIAYYLGYENILLSYKWGRLKTSVELQNIESGYHRGFIQATISYPILKNISLYTQFFNGYGQSLIEYNHKNTGVGIGVALNDWIN